MRAVICPHSPKSAGSSQVISWDPVGQVGWLREVDLVAFGHPIRHAEIVIAGAGWHVARPLAGEGHVVHVGQGI